MSGRIFIVTERLPFTSVGLILGFVSCLALVSCSSGTEQVRTSSSARTELPRPTVANAPASQPVTNVTVPADTDYRIQPLDTIQISVFNEADLSVNRRVSPQGNITYPLLGSVQVGGLTINETEEKLRQQLGRNFLVNPQVNVLVDRSSSRRVFILGQVKSPGAYEISADEGLTVVQAIAHAGGFTDVAAVDRVNVVRSERGAQTKIVVNVGAIMKGGDGSKDIKLKPDDVVSVPETIF
jgi:polysaccharide biosynthesis/export protein